MRWLGYCIHQWMKNLLLLILIMAGNQFGGIESWLVLELVFVSFSLCESTIYIANDLFDLVSARSICASVAAHLLPGWFGLNGSDAGAGAVGDKPRI